MLILPDASGAGRLDPFVPPDSCTRKYWPEASEQVPEGQSAVVDQLAAEAEAYCTDQPVMSVVVVPRLNSSMKSFLYGAPEVPPPPKILLITTRGFEAGVVVGVGVGVVVGVGVGVGVEPGVGPLLRFCGSLVIIWKSLLWSPVS